MISLFVPPTAKRPYIEFPYEVNPDDDYLCPCDLLQRDVRCSRQSGAGPVRESR
jgi:hypothetical protein